MAILDPKKVGLDEVTEAIRRDAAQLIRRAVRLRRRIDALAQARGPDALAAALGDDADEVQQVLDISRPLAEKHPDAPAAPVTMRAQTVHMAAQAKMPRVSLAAVGKPVSRLVMGTNKTYVLPRLEALYDLFFEQGGSAFDGGSFYQGGRSDQLVGEWMRSRGVRDQCVVIAKGCHPETHDARPEFIAGQVARALEDFQTDMLDVFMPIYDNADVPAAEFIDALNEQVARGFVKSVGISNATLDRVDAANAYAASKGLMGYTSVSNHLSLARMVSPICVSPNVSSWKAEDRAWFAAHPGVTLIAWSSQARGFFYGRETAEVLRCWWSRDNLARLERAKEKAAGLGTTPGAVALAWVLAQPFEPLAIIGPDTPEDLRNSLAAFDVALSPADLAYLEHG